MSKKITESMLKGLVEQVLNEKGLPVTDIETKDDNAVKDELGIPHGGRSSTPMATIKSIASQQPEANELDKVDFEAVFNETDWSSDENVKRAESALKIYYYSKHQAEVQSKILQAYEKSNYNTYVPALPANPSKTDISNSTKRHKFKLMVDQRVLGKRILKQNPKHSLLMFIAARQEAQALGDNERVESVRAAFKRWLKNKTADKSLTADELIDLNKIFNSFDESDVTVPSIDLPLESTFEPSRTFGKIPSATLSVFNKFKSDAKTADQITKKLISFSNLIKDSANGDSEAIESLQSIAKKDPGMIISAGMILKYFSMVIAEISAMEAGKFFEAFSAMLFSGKVVGGDAGASDVFLYDSDSQKIFTSQKLYSSLDGVKQKIGKRSLDGKGVWADTADANTIFYFCGIKDDSQKTSSVAVYICGVSRITRNDQDVFYLLDKNGKRTKIQVFQHDDGNLLVGKAMALNRGLFKVGTIPVVDDLAEQEQIRTMDSLLSKSYENVASEALDLSKVIFSNAKKLEVEAVNYTQSTNVRDQMKTADSLISGYDEIKSNLGGFIESFAQDEYKKMNWSKTWAKDKAATVTESMLKKLIEENFKK